MVEKYKAIYGEQIIAGYRNGYFTSTEETEVAKEIALVKPDILFVAITSPKKEIFFK